MLVGDPSIVFWQPDGYRIEIIEIGSSEH